MATLIDWSQVKTKVDAYLTLHDCETKSIAMGYVLLECLLDLSPEEIEDAITDGSQDRGIDAVVLQEQEGRELIHIFQFKYVEDFSKAENNFPSSEIDKLLSFIGDVLKKDGDLERNCNTILWGKVQEIWEAFERGTPSFVVHLAGNLEALTPVEQDRLQRSLAPYRNFTVRYHTLASVARLLIEARAPQIDRDIRLVDDQYFERVDGNIRGLIATVQGVDLVNLIRNPDDNSSVLLDIFDENVRVYLTSNNRINSKIIESALSELNAEFWYLNNGITMTCDSMEYPPKTRAPVLRMKNVQIVNGGQTSNALFEAATQNLDRFRNVLVLIRVYETKQDEMNLKIAISTNSQTPIRSRDLRSNDDVQRKLEESFKDLGLFYERKYGQYKDQNKDLRIDAMLAGQAYLAYTMGYPEVAAKDRGKIFGELYDTIFNDDITAQRLLIPLEIFKSIEHMKRDLQRSIRSGYTFDRNMLFLIDGAYHLLYAINVLCELRNLDSSNVEVALGQMDDAVHIVQKAVNEEEKDPAFALKRFFKSTRAKRYIQAEAQRVNHQGTC